MNKHINIFLLAGIAVCAGMFFPNNSFAATSDFTIGNYYFLSGVSWSDRFVELKKGGFDLEIAEHVDLNSVPDNEQQQYLEVYCNTVLSLADSNNIPVIFNQSPFFGVGDRGSEPSSQYRQNTLNALKNCSSGHHTFWGLFTNEEVNESWKFTDFIPAMQSGYNALKAALPKLFSLR